MIPWLVVLGFEHFRTFGLDSGVFFKLRAVANSGFTSVFVVFFRPLSLRHRLCVMIVKS
jgi:hypothetical protein